MQVYSQLVFELAQGREAKEAIRAAAADVGVDLGAAGGSNARRAGARPYAGGGRACLRAEGRDDL